MKYRVKFTKTGSLKFIGHLDVMRYFQKALRRADFDMKLTEGFNPHPVMSFAAPLSLGDTSESEYMDVELLSATHSQEMMDALNAKMAEGIEILSIRVLPEKCKNVMAATQISDNLIYFRECAQMPCEDFFAGLDEFLKREQIIVKKEGRKGVTETDMKPFIREWKVSENSLFMKGDSASGRYVNPKLVIKAYAESRGLELDTRTLELHRVELYTIDDEGRIMALNDVGADF